MITRKRTAPVAMVAALSLLLAMRGNAQASDPAASKASARALLVEGADLLKRGEYEEALRRFEQAYAEVPSPKIFYNYGLAHRGMGRNADALAAFQRFLAEATDATPDTREKADRQCEELLKKVAAIGVAADVVGAEISVDGRSYGITPRRALIYLDAGPHQLVVEKGTAKHTERIMAVAGQRQTHAARLGDSAAVNSPPVATEVTAPTSEASASGAPPADDDRSSPVAPSSAADPGRSLRIAGWVTGAGAAAFLGLGVVEMIVAGRKADEYGRTPSAIDNLRSCGTDLADHGGGGCPGLYDDWRGARRLAIVGLVGGGLLAATSATLFVMSARRTGEGRSLACAPNLGQLGLSCGGRF